MKLIIGFDSVLERISRYGLIGCLLGVLGFAFIAIVLRWFGSSVMWIDPLVRHLVFLSAFLGGSLATSAQQHIKIDLFSRLVEMSSSKVLHWIHRNLVTLFCFLTTLILVKASWDFYLVEREFGAPSFLEIHSAWLVAIIPFGMGLICLRFFNQLLLGIFAGGKK